MLMVSDGEWVDHTSLSFPPVLMLDLDSPYRICPQPCKSANFALVKLRFGMASPYLCLGTGDRLLGLAWPSVIAQVQQLIGDPIMLWTKDLYAALFQAPAMLLSLGLVTETIFILTVLGEQSDLQGGCAGAVEG